MSVLGPTRGAIVSAIVAAGCSRPADHSSVPAPRSPPAPPADATPALATSDASVPIDACADRKMASQRGDYPVPAAAEIKVEPPNSGWFFDGQAWHHILAACDLRDRVVMLDDRTYDTTSGGSMWIWSRRDGSAAKFGVDETAAHTGHRTSTAKTAPVDDRVVDFMPDATMFHGYVGPTYATRVGCRTGGDADRDVVEYLVACSTRQHFAEIDVRAPPPCSSFPDGIGWPLSIALTDAKDARSVASGSLATISADRSTWTYRFGTGDDRVELELRVGARHGGELRLAKGKPEPCVMIFNDDRRTPEP